MNLQGIALKTKPIAADRNGGFLNSSGQNLTTLVINGSKKGRTLDIIRRFEYRRPRLTTGFSVEFVLTEQTLYGLCRDVSDAGIRAEFNGAMSVGKTGMLILRHPMRVLRLEAEVAYLGKSGAGLSFLFDSTQQRELTVQFISQITAQSDCANGLIGKSHKQG
jgi:hypothetical protein